MVRISIISLFILFGQMLVADQVAFQRITLDMEQKILQNKQVTVSKARIYYQANGDMVTHTSYPKEVMMVNNRKGSLSVYNPETHTVTLIENFMYSTENSQFYFFLQNKKSDMGLKNMGFHLQDTQMQGDKIITWWGAPSAMRKVLKRIMLVHEAGNPVYMKYIGNNYEEVKKVYYYNYFKEEGISFPTTITQFDYLPTGDSIITRTVYSNFQLNDEVQSDMFDYQIPADAQLVEFKPEKP